MNKRGKIWKGLTLLHPKNLAREVHIYGYHFSWKTHSAWILGALIGSGMLGLLFQLKAVYVVIIAAAVSSVLPILVLDMYKRMYEQKRFADVAAYMEQMLYSFQKTGKVTGALKETRELFAEGQMRQCVDAAICHMELGKPKTAQGVLAEGLELVEEQYGCAKLTMVHELLRTTETYGGAAEESILLILQDIERWKKRKYQLQAEKKKFHVDNVISIVVAVILCAVALYVLEAMRQMFGVGNTTDIFSIPVIQVSSTVFILLLLKILVKSTKELTEDWLNEADVHDSAYILHSYDLVTNYENKEGERRKIWPSAVLMAIVMVAFIWKRAMLAGAAMMALAGVLVYQKMVYHLAKKDVTEAMYLALPQWLIELMLLLQHNNVQVALMKSVDGAPSVLKSELGLLRERMMQSPGELQTYIRFCQNFDLPEVGGCMKMLHAFSENGTGNLGVQMNQFLARVGQMQDCADVIRDGKIAFQMKMIFSYPVLAAIGKLLIDLTVGMAVMLQVLGSIGGA